MSIERSLPIGSTEYYDAQIGTLKRLQSVSIPFPNFPTNLDFLLVKHELGDDLPSDIDELVANSDLLLLEGLCWYPDAQESWQSVSDGDKSAVNEVAYNEFNARLAEVVLGKGVTVKYCDLPHSKKTRSDLKQLEDVIEPLTGNNPAHVIAIQRNNFEKWFRTVWLPRERHIIKDVYSHFEEPDEKDALARGLFIIGAGHKTIPDTLRWKIEQAGMSATHQVTDTTYYDLGDDDERYKAALFREYVQGGRLSDILLGRMMIEGSIRNDHQMSPENKKSALDDMDAMGMEEITERINCALQRYRQNNGMLLN